MNTATRVNEIVQECKLWEDIIRSKDDYLDRYAEPNLDFLQYGKVRDAIIFNALGPEDYRYDPDTSTDLKDFPKDVDVARFHRTLELLGEIQLDFAYMDEPADHINAILGFLYWSVGLHEDSLEALHRLEEPTQLAMLVARALALGIPGYFAPSN